MMKDLRGLVSLMSSLLSVRCKGPTFDLSGMPKACPLEGMVRRRGGAHDLNSSEMFTEHTV